jgi:Family of unknown function (DUF6232)
VISRTVVLSENRTCAILNRVSVFVTAFCEAAGGSMISFEAAPMQPLQNVNRPWDITGGTLRIGRQRVRLADVQGASPIAREERDFLASLLNYSAYLIFAGIFMVLVVQAGWRERFLLATIFFAIVGFTSILDVGLATRVRLYRLRIALADGGSLDFTTADAGEVDRLTLALRQAGRV